MYYHYSRNPFFGVDIVIVSCAYVTKTATAAAAGNTTTPSNAVEDNAMNDSTVSSAQSRGKN